MDKDHNYVFKQSNSYARSLIVFKWMVVGFLLTTSYKSVLLAMMTNIYYEKTIDTIDDMFSSERILWVPNETGFRDLMALDPRMKVQELAERVVSYHHGRGQWEDIKDWVQG